MPVQNGGSLGDVIVHTAGAAGDDALIDVQLAIYQLVSQMQRHLAAKLLLRELLGLTQDVRAVFLQIVNGERARGMERQRRHRLDL